MATMAHSQQKETSVTRARMEGRLELDRATYDALVEHARSDLHKLKPLANEEAIANAWLDQFDVIINDVEKIRDKANDNDTAAVQALAGPALDHDQHANELASQLGMSVCNKG